MSHHLDPHHSINKYLKDTPLGRQIKLEAALGMIKAKPRALTTSKDHHSHLTLSYHV